MLKFRLDAFETRSRWPSRSGSGTAHSNFRPDLYTTQSYRSAAKTELSLLIDAEREYYDLRTSELLVRIVGYVELP